MKMVASSLYGDDMKRTVILIDGQNLYYNLKELGLIESRIKWNELFQSIIEKNEDELIRTYWFRPQKILDTYFTEYNIRNQIFYKKHNTYYESFRNKTTGIPSDVNEKVNVEVKEVLQWINDQKIRFSKIEYNYDQIVLNNNDIEIVKTGIVKIDPYLKIYLGEKGVDISLAVKMISLSVENRCDKIILISGDYDYAEAVKYVKDHMKKIHIVKIHKGYPPKNKSVSRDLAVLADKVIPLYESEIKEKFLIQE
jgi:uncharacterized LabA/DUF88 family protein